MYIQQSKNKKIFLYIFFICYFMFGCICPKNIDVKLIDFTKSTNIIKCHNGAYDATLYVAMYRVIASENKMYSKGNIISETKCIYDGDGELINFYTNKIGQIIHIGNNECGCAITPYLGLP